jgi:heptaprenyl diphosphate synthase
VQQKENISSSSYLPTNNNSVNDEIVNKTTLILLAVAINALEFFIPRIPFFPWLKPGLANCVTILWIVEFGVIDALLFSLLRIWIAGYYFGFSFYTISLSLSGGICSTLAMGLVWTALGKRGWIGSIGLGILGALVHNLTQIVVIYFLLAKNAHLFYQIPLMFAAAIVFGSLTGAIAPALLHFTRGMQLNHPDCRPAASKTAAELRTGWPIIPLFLFCAGCCVAFINEPTVLLFLAIAGTLAVQGAYRGSLSLLFSPMTRFWPMFLFIACVHCFLSYGAIIEGFPLVTYEGVRLTVVQWLKLWTWLELSFLLTRFHLHIIVLKLLRALFRGNQTTLFAGVLALEYFPAIVGTVQKKARSRFFWRLRRPVAGARAGIAFIYREIERMLLSGER